MAGKTTDAVKQITYLAGALKAPRITEAASRMADQARDAGWSFEDYLAAVLEREVSRPQRVRRGAADQSRRVPRPQDPRGLRLGRPTRRPGSRSPGSHPEGSCSKRRTSCCSARPEPGRPTSRPRSGSSPPGTATGCCSRPRRTGSPASPTPTGKAGSRKSSPGCAATG